MSIWQQHKVTYDTGKGYGMQNMVFALMCMALTSVNIVFGLDVCLGKCNNPTTPPASPVS